MERRYLHVSSAHRTSGTIEKPYFVLDRVINTNFDKTLGNRARVLIAIVNASIPFSFYSLPQSKSKIYYSSLGNSVPDGSFSLQAGNYNVFQLIKALIEGLGSVGYNDAIINYNRITNKLSFSSATGFKLYFDFDDTPYLNFGLNKETYTISSIITSPNVVNVQPINDVFIRLISQLIINQQETGNSTGFSNILAKIPIDVNANEVISYEPRMIIECVSLADVINGIQFELKDQNGDILDLNGLDWEATLLFQYDLSNIEG